MASEVGICNRGLQKLGADRITSLTQDSRNARSCNALYETVRDAELRNHPWSFAVKRIVLAPDVTAPAFDYDYAFTLPSDCLRILPPNDHYLDWQVEDGAILTNYGDTLNLRYLCRVTDPNKFDALFLEALACRIAVELCEELTQSNQKAQGIRDDYRQIIRDARRTNAMEKMSDDPPEDPWVTARL
jgi:hypothetical protein